MHKYFPSLFSPSFPFSLSHSYLPPEEGIREYIVFALIHMFILVPLGTANLLFFRFFLCK